MTNKFHALMLFSFLCMAGIEKGYAVAVNVNFGAPPPASSFGSASGQTGEWNGAVSCCEETPLFDLKGNTIAGASLKFEGSVGSSGTNSPSAFPVPPSDDVLLLIGRAMNGGNAGMTIEILGLDAGLYDIYTYALATRDIDRYLFAAVDVVGSLDPTQEIGGSWTGEFLQGTTYALHRLLLETGQLVEFNVNPVAGPSFPYPAIAGIQVVPVAIPEPNPVLLALLGLAGMWSASRKRPLTQ